ncbi:MAG: class I SAM-dependent methyltransferase [Bosea sp.]|nr:class I SAM-dependent methyltransferase [Bosea sp. (in: a-proteobacteria)]
MIAAHAVVAATSALELGPQGIWFAHSSVPVSYPEDANALFREIEDRSFWFLHRNRCLAHLARRFRPDGPFLDIGGGNGFVAKALVAEGVDCALLEPGVEGALAAHARGISPVICARIEDAALPSQAFSGVGMFDVLEHIEDEAGALAEVQRLLRPGGRLFLTVPAYQALFSREDQDAGHFRRYNLPGLERVLEAAGFRSQFATYLFAPLPLPVFLLRTLPSRLGLLGPSSAARTDGEHTPGGAFGWTMEKLLKFEARRIEAGGTIPFGTSCLVVADRP